MQVNLRSAFIPELRQFTVNALIRICLSFLFSEQLVAVLLVYFISFKLNFFPQLALIEIYY